MEDKKIKSSGFIHIPTGLKFENRKQACKIMGQNRYRKALKNKEFEWCL